MINVVTIAWLGAVGIAMCSAIFGVGVARVLWADDLRHSKHIDEIRNKTEASLRKTIEHLEATISHKNRTIEILQRTP